MSNDIRQYLPDVEPVEPPLRQSAVTCWYQCPRLFLFLFRLCLVLRGYLSAPTIGQLFHLCQNARYAGHSQEEADQLVDRQTERRITRLVTQGEDRVGAETLAALEKQVRQDAALAKVMATVHWNRYPLDTDRYRVIAIEQKHRIELPGLIQPVEGRIDLVLEGPDEITGKQGLILLDHKTSRQPAMYQLTGEFSLQKAIYGLLLQDLLPDRPLLGFIFNVIQKPQIQWKDWQSYQDYLAECTDWYAGQDDPIGTGQVFRSGPRKGLPKPRWEHAKLADRWLQEPPMRSFPLRYTQPIYTRELHNTLLRVNAASVIAPCLNSFPRTGDLTGRCQNHWGRVCPFIDLCSVDPINWRGIVERQYRPREEEPEETYFQQEPKPEEITNASVV